MKNIVIFLIQQTKKKDKFVKKNIETILWRVEEEKAF